MNKGIGKTLKGSRISAKMTVREISDILVSKGFKASESTIYSWENENSQPTPGAFLVMCQAYGIKNVLNTFGYNCYDEDGTLQLNTNEIDMIEKYRNLDDHGKKRIAYELEEETKRISHIQELETKLIEAHIRLCLYPYMRKIACAGDGFYFDDIPTETLKAPYMEGADFIIGVNGDSMEPDYFDGDKVYVKKTNHLNLGDVGIFTIGNECYIKELGKDRLISRNKDYPDIPGTEDVRPIGKVIGKVEED